MGKSKKQGLGDMHGKMQELAIAAMDSGGKAKMGLPGQHRHRGNSFI